MNNFDKQAFIKSLESPAKSGCLTVGLGLAALIFIGLCVGAVLYPQDGSKPAAIILGIFGGLFLLGFIYSLLPYNPEKDPTIIDARKGANHIVWMYPHEQTVNGLTSHWVYYMTKDGELKKIPTVTAERQTQVIEGFAQLYPSATLGYSKEIEGKMFDVYKK